MNILKPCIIIICLILGGCSAKASWDYNNEIDFSQYKTYKWMDKEHAGYDLNGLNDARIKKSVDKELQSKLTKTDKNPDIIINYFINIETRTDVDTMNLGFGYNHFGMGTSVYSRDYQIEILSIDFIDAKSNKLIWRGVTDNILRYKSSVEDRDNLIKNQVNSILSNYPPK